MTPHVSVVVLSLLLLNLNSYTTAKLICIYEDLTEATLICRMPNLRLNVLTSSTQVYGLLRNQQPNEVRISNCRLVSIEGGFFSSFKSTRSLDLSHNVIDSLPDDVFVHLQELRFLNLSNNVISSVVPEMFQPLAKIQSLDLSNNLIPDESLGTISGLRKIKFLDLSGNGQISKVASLLNGLNLKSLRVRNASLTIPNQYFVNMPNMVFLDLSYNNKLFSTGDAAPVLRQCQRIVYLRMSNCKLNTIHEDFFAGIDDLTYLDISNNGITSLSSNQFYTNTELSHFDASHNKLTDLSEMIFRLNSKIFSLKLNSNELKTLPTRIFYALVELETLDLGDNQLEVLSNLIFSQNKNLHTLYLDTNRIKSITPYLFVNNINLETLILSNNSIATFEYSFIATNENLGELRLDNNKLTEISNSFFQISSQIYFLNVSCNLIMSVNPPPYGAPSTEIYIQGNPWNCACLNRMLGSGFSIRFIDERSHEGRYPSCIIGSTDSTTCDNNISRANLRRWHKEFSYHPSACRSKV